MSYIFQAKICYFIVLCTNIHTSGFCKFIYFFSLQIKGGLERSFLFRGDLRLPKMSFFAYKFPNSEPNTPQNGQKWHYSLFWAFFCLWSFKNFICRPFRQFFLHSKSFDGHAPEIGHIFALCKKVTLISFEK